MACDEKQLAENLAKESKDGRIPCAAALAVGSRLACPSARVGEMLDRLEIRIELCQLGLFGYGPGKKKRIRTPDFIPDEVRLWLKEHQKDKGHVTCLEIFGMAEKGALSKAHLAGACEELGIKVRACQIGAFA